MLVHLFIEIELENFETSSRKFAAIITMAHYVSTRRQMQNTNEQTFRKLRVFFFSKSGEQVPQETINRCTWSRVLFVSGTFCSIEKTCSTEENHLANPPCGTTCSSLTNGIHEMHRPLREDSNNSRQMILIGSGITFFLFS